MKLNRIFLNKIRRLIDNTFNRLWLNLVGTGSPHEDNPNTLPNLFKQSNTITQLKHDQGTLSKLLDISKGYIETQKEKTKNEIIQQIENAALNSELPNKVDFPIRNIQKTLPEILNKTTNQIKTIVVNESHKIKTIGVLSDIIALNNNIGINDPIICWLCVHDSQLCLECKKLHLMPDGITPKLWRLSEVGHGFHQKGDSFPKIEGLHPNDRCEIVTMMNGWGFINGKVSFIKDGFNALEEQRNNK